MTTNATASILFKTGKTSYEVKSGKLYAYQAKAGEFYRIVTEADGKLLRNVIAKRRGDDLHLEYADGTVVTLKNYYNVCKSAASCKVTLPSDAGAGYVPGMDLAPGVALGDG